MRIESLSIPAATLRAIRAGIASLDPAYAECIEAALPDLTIISPDQCAELERMMLV